MVYILDVLDSHVRFQESCVVVEAEHIEPLLTPGAVQDWLW